MPEEEKKKKAPKENKEVVKLKEEISLLNEKNLRLMAEMQNMKRHYSEDLLNLSKRDGEKFIKELLPIIDNFERAIKMDDNNLEDSLSKFLDGFKMIYTSMISNLNKEGVHEIECLNKTFDPTVMEAVLTDHDESKESGVVLEVLQKGYKYNDILLRPAMVKVNQ